MSAIFAVIRSRGAGWRASLPMEAQEAWRRHAEFMNSLAKDGFVLLGGPLDGTSDVLLIVRALDEDEIRMRLSSDPWSEKDILPVARVMPWTLRLGSLG